jgi:hypothetical protein
LDGFAVLSLLSTTISCMSKTLQTKVASNGLRYTSKVSGSPFLGNGSTMSCFRCGKHRTADQLQTKKLIGRNQRVCKPSCAELDAARG